MAKQTLPNVTQYTKNVIKSTLYASSGVAENLMPGYLEFKETNKEVFKAAYVAIRDYRKTFQRIKDAIVKSKVYEAADKGLENIKSDLRTGMWYNKGRETEFDNQAMMSGDDFGLGEMTGGSSGGSGGGDLGLGDIDFNIDDMFKDEPSEDEMLDITDGDELIADTVKKTSAKSTAAINDIQVKGVEVLLKSNRAAANMAYIQSEKMMKIAEEGFSTLNQTTSNILKFNTEGLQKHIENAASYFTNTEKLAQERNAMLKELVEMQRGIYKMYQIQEEKKEDPNKPKKYTWGSITTSSGMPALEEYFGAIKQNLERELDNAGMGMIKAMSGLAGENPLLAMVQNPLGDIVTMIVTTALGATLANAAKGLDRNLSSIFGNFIAGMNHMGDEGEGPLSLIGKIFGIRDVAKNTLDTANYKRGPLPWDGDSKRALVEVIPHYLANIEAALTGRHQLFDYQTGRYVDSAALKDQYLSIVDRYTYQPFSDVDQIMRNFFKSFKMYKSEDQKELVKTWVNMRKYAAGGKGRWKNMFNFDTSKPREDEEELDDLAMEVGSPKEFIRDILNYLKMATGKGDKNNPAAKLRGQRGLLMEVEGKIMESREKQTRDFTNMEEQGTILNQLFNNGYMQWRDAKGILRNNQTAMERMHLKYQKDDRGNNIFYYLQRILGSLMLIQTEGFGLGDSKQIKDELRIKQQRRKLHRGQKTDGLMKLPAQSNQTMHRIEAMMNQIRDDEYQKDKTEDQLYNKRERERAERDDKQFEEKTKKQAEDKRAGKQVKGPIVVGMDNKNKPDDETYTTLIDAGIRDMHTRNVDEELVHFAEMTRVMEDLMIKGVKQATDKNESDKTWLGKQYAKFKESNDEEDKKYRAEIQKVGFLDALLQADDIGDKWGTIRVGLEDLAEKPSALLTKVLEEADERLYQFFFTEEEMEDKRNGKKYKGFFGRMRAHLDNLFVDMNAGLNKYLFQPLKDKLGVEGPWDAVKKGLGYIGIDVDAIGAEIKDNMGEGLKSVWENIKETVTEFFSDAAESIAEDERKARELNSKDETYTKQFEDWVTGGSSDKKEEKKEETKKGKIRTIFDDPNSTLEQKAEALRISRDIIQNSSPAELRMIVDEKMRKYNKHIGYDTNAEIENIKNNMRSYDTRTMTNEDRKKAMQEYDRLISLSSNMGTKKLAIQEIMKLENRDDKRSRDLDKEIKYISKGLADIENKLNKPDEYNIDELNERKQIAETRLAKLQAEKNKSFTIGDDRKKQYQELLSFIDNSLFGTESGQKTELNPISELRDKRTNSVKMTGIQRAMKMKSHIDHLAETKFKEGDFDLYSDLNREQIKMMDEFVKANPGYVFDRHESYIKNWIENALNVKNKAAVSAIVNKMKSEFVKDPNHDIKKIFQFKFLKGIVDDIVKAYEDRNFDISSGGVDARVGQAVKDSIASQRLESFNQDEDMRDYLWSAEIVEPFTESVNEAARGITDLNELIKVSLNEDSPIYKKLDEILNALNKPNEEETPVIVGPDGRPLTGNAQGRESLELAPAETAIVSKGEIIKPLVGPSEKITKTGLYNLGRGDAVIPNPSQSTIERNKIEESNKLNEISKDIASGNDISKHMATTKRYSLGRGIFNIDTGDSDNVEVTEKEDKDNLISLSIGYAKGRDNIYNLDDKKGQEDYVNSIVKVLTEDLPKYAESRPPVRIEATDEAKLNYILSNKDRFKNKEFDPEQIAILSALIKGEKEDNKYKKDEAKTLSNISDMYGYLVNTINDMIDGKKDDEKIKVGNKEVTVKELKTINSFIRRSKQEAYNTELVTGISSSTLGRMIGDGINNAKEGAIEILTGLTGLESENVKKSVKETYAEVKKGMPNVIAKGTVGLIGGTLLGGPLVGALLGSAVGVAESSETFRSTLFGSAIRDKETNEIIGRKDDGLIGKETIEAYKKYMPGIKGYGLLGTALGLVTPFGLLGGALLGAGFGVVSRTDEFQAAFFGKKGIFDKDTRDFFKKAAPNAAAAAAAMAFLGPFGLVGNLFVGGAAGFLSSTEQFKTYLFGKEDDQGKRHGGIVGALKHGVVDPWLDFGKKVSKDLFGWIKTDVFGPLKGAIAPIGKQIQLGITGLITGMGRMIRQFTEVVLGKQIAKKIENALKWISGKATKGLEFLLKPVKFALSAPSKMIGAVGDILRRRQVALGNADYMSAGERMKFREKNRMNMEDQYAVFDSKIATSSTDNLSNILEAAKLMETGDKGLKEYRDDAIRKLFANIDSYLVKNGEDTISQTQRDDLEKLLMSDNVEDVNKASKTINDLTSSLGGHQQKKVRDVLGKMTQDVFAKKTALDNYRVYGEDAIAKLFKDELGIEADNNNIGKFRSMLEKELSVRKQYDKDVAEGKVSGAEQLLNKSIVDQTSVLGSKLTDIVVEIKALSAGLLSQEQIEENRRRMSDYNKDTEKVAEVRTKEMEDLRTDLESYYGKDRVEKLKAKDYDRLTEKHRKFGGKSLGSKLVEMGKAGFDPEHLYKIAEADNEVIYRAVKLFETVGYQTDNLKKLEKLSENEFSTVINAAVAGLQFKSFDEVKDLTDEEIVQMLYIYDVSKITPQKLPVGDLKEVIRRDGFGAKMMAQDRSETEQFFQSHKEEIEGLKVQEREEEVRKSGRGDQNLTFKAKKSPIVSNIIWNALSTTGHDTMEAVGKVGRKIGYDPIRDYPRTTTKEMIDQRFASGESLRDFTTQFRSAIERHLDPENEKGTKAIADIMSDAVIREIKRGHSIESIENMFDAKIKRNDKKGGYDISGYNGNAVKITNEQIRDFKKDYSEYDDLYRFFQVVMDDPKLQDLVEQDLVKQGFSLADIASYLKSEQYRGPITRSEKKPIEKVLLSGYSEDVIKDFKQNKAIQQQQMMKLLLDKGYTEEEIENYKKGIQGHASGRSWFSNIKDKASDFFGFNRPKNMPVDPTEDIDETKKSNMGRTFIDKTKAIGKKMLTRNLIKRGIKSLDLQNIHKEFTNKNLIKAKLFGDVADYLGHGDLYNFISSPRQNIGNYLKDIIMEYTNGNLNSDSLFGSIMDLLSRNSIESIQQLSNMTPEQITQVLQTAQSMPMFAEGRSWSSIIRNKALQAKYKAKRFYLRNQDKIKEGAKDLAIEELLIDPSISGFASQIQDEDNPIRRILEFIADNKLEKLAEVLRYLDPETVNQISMAMNQATGLNMFAGGRRGRMIKRAEKLSGRKVNDVPTVDAELEDIKVPKIEDEIKNQFEGIESENALRFMVYNQVKKFNELGLIPNQEVLGKLDYKNGLVGLINSGFSMKKLFEFDPKNMEVKFTDVEGKEFKVNADFYENMSAEEQSNLMKSLISQAMNKDNKGVVTIATPDGDRQIKIADDNKAKTIQIPTMYGIKEQILSSDKSYVDSGKDSEAITEKVNEDHEARLSTASDISEIKEAILDKFSQKEKPKQEKKSFMEMLMDLLKMLAAFFLGGGLMALLGAASDSLSDLIGRAFRSALSLTEKAIVNAINEAAKPLKDLAEKLKVKLNISRIKVPGFKSSNLVRGAVSKEEAALAARLSKIAASEGTGPKGKAYNTLSEAEAAEFKALQEKGIGSLESAEAARFTELSSKLAQEKEINSILNKIRQGGIASLTDEEFGKLSALTANNSTLDRVATRLDSMAMARAAESEKAIRESVKRTSQIFNTEIGERTLGDVKSSIKETVLGGRSLTGAELERRAMLMANKGMASEYILKNLGVELKDGQLVKTGTGLSSERSALVSGLENTKNFGKFMGQQVVDGTKAVGEAIGEKFERVGNKITSGFNAATQPIRNVGNAISQGIGDATSKLKTSMLGQYTKEDIAKIVANMQQKGATNQEIISAVKEMQGSQRTFLGNIVDRAKGIGPVFEGGEWNLGATSAEAGERGLTEKFASAVVKAHTLPIAALGAAGTAAGGIAKAMYTPFKNIGEIASGLDTQLAQDLGMKYKAATFAPRMLLGMPGFAVDSFKDTFSMGKAVVKGGVSTGIENMMAEAVNVGKLGAREAATGIGGKIVRAGVEAGEAVIGPLTSAIARVIGIISEGLGKFLSFIPGVDGSRIAKGLQKVGAAFSKEAIKNAGKRGMTQIALKVVSKVFGVMFAAELTKAMYDGFANPGATLQIKDQSKIGNGLRVVAAIANALSHVALTLVSPQTIASLCLDVFGDLVGFGEEEQKMQEESIEEYEAWKATVAEGEDNSFEAFMKASGTFNDNDVITNVGNFIWEGFKSITAEIPQFIMGKLSEGAESMFKLGDHVRSITDYWNKLSDRSSAIMNGLGKLTDEELAKLDAGVEIAPDDPLFGIKNTMKDFAANHWFLMASVGWAIGKIGSIFGGIFDGAGDMINGIKSQLSANFSAMIEGDPIKILSNLWNGDGSESRTGFMNGVGRVVTMIATVPTLTIATILAPIRLIRTAYEKVEESFEAFPQAKDHLDEMSKLADNGQVMAIWDLDNPFNSSMASGVGDLMAGIMYGIGKTGYMVMGAYNYVANGIMNAVNSAMSWMAGKNIDLGWYDKYELKEILDSEYINHAEVKFDPTHPLTAIPSAVESMYKLLKYPFKLVGYIFTKFTSTKGIISTLIDKAKSIFGSMDDIDKQNRSMINKSQSATTTDPRSAITKTMAPSALDRSADVGADGKQGSHEVSTDDAIRILQKPNTFSKGLDSDEKRNKVDSIVKAAVEQSQEDFQKIYEEDRRIQNMLLKIHESKDLQKKRNDLRLSLEQEGFTIDDETLEAMVYNVIRGKNVYGKGILNTRHINPYLQNAPGNEKIKYNIPGDTKVDTVAARACGPFAMGAAKDYVTGSRTNMGKELKLGRSYLAPDDGTKFDYFKDSGSKSGLNVKQTSDMSEIDKATKDPNSAVVGMVDTGRGIHYETFTDKVDTKGKSYYNTIDPEKPNQVLSDKDTIAKQLKTSFIVKRATGRRGIYGKGNELRIDQQNGPTCTIEATRSIYRAYTGKEAPFTGTDQDFDLWYPIMKNDLQSSEQGFSRYQKSEFEAAVESHFNSNPGKPILLYQTGGAGSKLPPDQRNPINRVSGNHATVLGRKRSDGKYEDYDSNGGKVHVLDLGQIHDKSAMGSSKNGTNENESNLLIIPGINPNPAIDKYQGVGETATGSDPTGSEGNAIDPGATPDSNTKEGKSGNSIIDKYITNSAPVSNLLKIYNAFFGGDSGGGSNVPSPASSSGSVSRANLTGGLYSVVGEGYPASNPMGKVYRISIHHTGTGRAGTDWSAADCHKLHTETNHWDACGYHFIIRKNGTIERGRQEKYQGAHTGGENTGSLGIHVSGDFNCEEPTPEQIKSLEELICDIGIKYNFDINRQSVKGHYEWNDGNGQGWRSCPGLNLGNKLDKIVSEAKALTSRRKPEANGNITPSNYKSKYVNTGRYLDDYATYMSDFAQERYNKTVPTAFWRTILRSEQGITNEKDTSFHNNPGGMDYSDYMKEEFGATPKDIIDNGGAAHKIATFDTIEHGLQCEVDYFGNDKAHDWAKQELDLVKQGKYEDAFRLHVKHYVGTGSRYEDEGYSRVLPEELARGENLRTGDDQRTQYGKGTDIEGYNGPDFNKITDNDSITVQQAKLEAQQKYMNTLSKPEQSKIWNTNTVNDMVKSLSDKDKVEVLSKWRQGSKFIKLQDKAAKIIPFRTDVDTSDMTGSDKNTIDEAFKAKEDLEQAVIKKTGIPFVRGKNINQRVKDSNFLAEMRRRIFTPQYGRGYKDFGDFKGSDIDTRAKYIWSYLKSGGMSDAGAAGVIGNFRVEDPPLDPRYSEGGAVHDTLEEHIDNGGKGYGLAQWTYHTRQDNLIKFAKSNNLSSGSLEAQLGFTKKEATEGYGDIWNRFAKETDPVEAAKKWMDEYEAPGTPHWDKRAEEAAKAYTEFSGKTYDNIKLPSDSSSGGGISNVASNAMGLIDKIILPAVAKAVEQAGYTRMLKEQYGIDVSASEVLGGNFAQSSSSNNTYSGSTTSTVAATSNGGAASGDSVGQAMLNFVPGSEITSPFGPRMLNGKEDFHNGIDIGYAGDTPVYSPINAIVDGVGNDADGYGNYVVLKDGDGKYYMFGHLNAQSVNTGQNVKQGDQLGLSGNTGHSFGDHLHFGVHTPDNPGALKKPRESNLDPMTVPIYGKGTTQDKENAADMTNFIEEGIDTISANDIDNYVNIKRIQTGKYGTGTKEDKREDIINQMAKEILDSYKKTNKEKNDTTKIDLGSYMTPGTFPEDKPNKGFDIFGGLFKTPTTTFPEADKNKGGFDLGNIFGGLFKTGSDIPRTDKESKWFDLGSIFSGGLGGLFNPMGKHTTTFPDFNDNKGFDLGGLLGGFGGSIGGENNGLISSITGLIGGIFNDNQEESFDPTSIIKTNRSRDVMPVLPKPIDEESIRIEEIKEIKPPATPVVKEETKEDIEAKAKKDIVEGTGYSDHLEAKIGQQDTSTDLASGSNFDKLINILSIIAENTGKLVELASGGTVTNNNTVNMNVRNNNSTPTSAKSGRNTMNDIMAIAGNLMQMISK